VALHPAPDVAFDLEVLGDGFDDPVAVPDLRKMIVEVARLDECGGIVGEESGGRCLAAVSIPFMAAALRPAAFGRTISRRREGIPALAKWAAMREPMVPAPSTATRRTVRMNSGLRVQSSEVWLCRGTRRRDLRWLSRERLSC